MENSIIELSHISKKFGDRIVLKDINLNIRYGELVTIMGKSGAGKSTLLNILGFFESSTSGEYRFDGKLVKKREYNRIRNDHIGFVFQSYNLLPQMTVYENVVLPIYYSQVSASEKRKRISNVNSLLEKYNISHIKDAFVDYISGGEKQRVCLARALSCSPQLIISDEPTGNLDSGNTSIVLDELKAINKKGKTVIIVTHDTEVENIASRKLFLEDGVIKQHDV
jgi:putative ABC transport system ATP-binding protein